MKSSMIGLAVVAGLALAGCGEKVDVHVECVTAEGPTVQCDISQTKGKSEVEVCWDFKVVCKNGTEIAPPRSCTKVKDGGKVHYTIPSDKIQNADKCDADPKPSLTNMTINGEPST